LKGREIWSGNWELNERFTDKETSTKASRRGVCKVTRSADKGVARWGAIYQFSGVMELLWKVLRPLSLYIGGSR